MNKRAQAESTTAAFILIIIGLILFIAYQHIEVDYLGARYIAGCEIYNQQTGVLNYLIQDCFNNSSTVFPTRNCT